MASSGLLGRAKGGRITADHHADDRRSAAISASSGLTLLEVLIASVAMTVVAGGMMITFLMATRLSQGSRSVDAAELLAQQTLERFRNRMACDDAWFTAPCDATALPGADTADPLPPGTGMGARTYTITPRDCDGNGTTGDCFQLVVKVTGVS